MAETLDGGLVLLYYGDTDDIDEAKSIVCETDSGFDGSRTTNAVDTKCGILKSLGRQNNKISGNGVTNIDPGPMEGSFADLLELYRLGTKQFIWYRDTDDNIFISGEGWFNQVGNQNKSGDLSTFSYTLEIDGDIGTTAESTTTPPITFDTELEFSAAASDTASNVTGTIDAGNIGEGQLFRFNATPGGTGVLPQRIDIIIGGVQEIAIDYRIERAGDPWSYTDLAGNIRTGTFTNDDVIFA